MCICTKTENTVHKPICKILYHNNEENKIRNKTNIKNINNGGKVFSAYFRRISVEENSIRCQEVSLLHSL